MADTEGTALLHEILIQEGDGTRIKQVAEVACVSTNTVYAWCDGRINPPLIAYKASFLVTGDPRLRRLLEPEGWVLCRARDRVGLEAGRSLIDEAADVFDATTDIRRAAQEALKDGHIDREEEVELERRIDAAQKELDEVSARLKAILAAQGRKGRKLHCA